MKSLPTISKVVNLLVILCFLLPFMPKGCSVSGKEKNAQVIADSIRIADSVKLVNPAISDSAREKITTARLHGTFQGFHARSEKIISRYPFLKPVLRPGDNYSGIGLMIDLEPASGAFLALFICFILSLISFILILIDKPVFYSFLYILSLAGLILLVTFKIYMFKPDPWLYGYKLELIFCSLLVIVNLLMMIRMNRIKK